MQEKYFHMINIASKFAIKKNHYSFNSTIFCGWKDYLQNSIFYACFVNNCWIDNSYLNPWNNFDRG